MRFCPILLVAIANILGRALLKSAAGDNVVLQLPGGTEYLTVLECDTSAFLWNRSVNHLDPRPRRRDSLDDAKPT